MYQQIWQQTKFFQPSCCQCPYLAGNEVLKQKLYLAYMCLDTELHSVLAIEAQVHNHALPVQRPCQQHHAGDFVRQQPEQI